MPGRALQSPTKASWGMPADSVTPTWRIKSRFSPRLCSASPAFPNQLLASRVMQLVEKEKVKLDDKVMNRMKLTPFVLWC